MVTRGTPDDCVEPRVHDSAEREGSKRRHDRSCDHFRGVLHSHTYSRAQKTDTAIDTEAERYFAHGGRDDAEHRNDNVEVDGCSLEILLVGRRTIHSLMEQPAVRADLSEKFFLLYRLQDAGGLRERAGLF